MGRDPPRRDERSIHRTVRPLIVVLRYCTVAATGAVVVVGAAVVLVVVGAAVVLVVVGAAVVLVVVAGAADVVELDEATVVDVVANTSAVDGVGLTEGGGTASQAPSRADAPMATRTGILRISIELPFENGRRRACPPPVLKTSKRMWVAFSSNPPRPSSRSARVEVRAPRQQAVGPEHLACCRTVWRVLELTVHHEVARSGQAGGVELPVGRHAGSGVAEDPVAVVRLGADQPVRPEPADGRGDADVAEQAVAPTGDRHRFPIDVDLHIVAERRSSSSPHRRDVPCRQRLCNVVGAQNDLRLEVSERDELAASRTTGAPSDPCHRPPPGDTKRSLRRPNLSKETRPGDPSSGSHGTPLR